MDSLPAPDHKAQELELLRRMARIANIGGWEYEPATQRLYWTEQVYRIVELEPQGAAPTLDAAVGYFAPEARATVARALQGALEQGEAWDLELPLVTARGRRIWVRMTGEPDRVDGRCVRLAGTFEDVTAARRARESLKARNAENRKLALVAEHANDLVLITDAQHRIEWVNPRFEQVTGYRAAEVLGKTPRTVLNRADTEQTPDFARLRDSVRRNVAVTGVELKLYRKDGTPYWAELEQRPVRDETGAVSHYIHIQRDISARRAAQQRERELAQRLQLIASGTHTGTFERDLATGAGTWDEQTFRLFGCAPAAAAPALETALARIHADDRARYRAFVDALKHGGPARDIEYRVVHDDGRVGRLHERCYVERSADGTQRLVGIVFDVTEAKRAEEQQRLLAERLALASRSAGIGIWEIDLDTQQVDWNDQMFRMYGLPADAAPPSAAEWIERWLHADDRARVAAHAVEFMRSGGSYQEEHRVVLRDGSVRWIDARAFLYRPDPDRPGRIIGVNFDITERKAAEQRLRDALGQLELATVSAGIGTYSRDGRSGAGHWDAQTWALFGLPPADGAPDPEAIVAAIHPDDRERYRAAVRDRADRPVEVEVRAVHPDGSIRWLLIRGRNPGGGESAHGHHAGIVLDVTARKLAEERAAAYARELRATLQRLELATGGSEVGIFERGFGKEPGFWSPQMFALYGEPPQANAPDWDWLLARIDPADHALFESQWERIRVSASYVDTEFRVRRPDGRGAWLLTRARFEPAADDRPARVVGIGMDITQRKQAELRAQQYADWLRLTTSTIGIGLWQRDAASGAAVWDAQLKRIFGLPEDAPTPTHDEFLALVVAEDRERLADPGVRMPPAGPALELEYRIRRADGEVRHVLARRATQFDADGRPLRVLGAAIDVTESRAARERARETAQLLHLATHAVGVGFSSRDLASGAGFWDARAREIFGFPLAGPAPTIDEFLARVDAADRARVASQYTVPPAAGTHDEVEFGIRLPDGSARRVLSRRAAQYGEGSGDGGRAQRLYAAVIDVTESRAAEARLRGALERLRLAAEAGGIASWERDLDSGRGSWDRMLFEFYGLPAGTDAPPLAVVLPLVHPDDRAVFADAWKKMAASDAPVEWEHRVVRRDGSVVHLVSRGRTERRAEGGGRIVGATLDVTASRRTAQQLKDALERLRLSTEIGAIGTWERDAVNGSARWDPVMFRLYGLPATAATPSRELAVAMVHPDDRAGALAAWKRMLEVEHAVEFEYRIVRPDGEIVFLNSRGRAERGADGRVLRIVGATIDLTASRTAQRRLQEISERLQLAAAATGIGFWIQGLDGSSLDADRQIRLMYGLDPDGAAPDGAQFFDAVLPDDRAAVLAARARALTSDEPVEVEYRIVHPQRGLRHLLTRRALRRDAGGQPLHVVGVSIDVTETRRAEAALRSANERLELATRTAGIGVWECALDGDRVSWDARMYALYGRPPDWTPTREAWLACVHPDDRAGVGRLLGDRSEHAEGGEAEFRIARPDGEERVLAERFVFRRDAAGRVTHVLGTNIDITDFRRAQRERDELSDRLRLATASVGMGVWVWDLASGKSVWDDAMYALFGHTRASFAERIWLDAVHPDDRPRAARAVQDAWDGIAPLDIEFRIVRPDGAVRHLAARGSVERDADGVVVRMVGVNWDVTESHAAEQRAVELAERLKLATAAAGLAAWHVDLRSGRMDADELLCRLHGVPPGPYDDLWRTLEATIVPDDLPALRQASIDARLNDRPFEAEYRTTHADGSVRHLAVRGVYQRDDAGEPVRMYGVTFDVSARVHAESALRAAEQTARNLLERMRMTTSAVGIGLWEVDLASGAVAWDDEMCKLHGRTRAELGDIAERWPLLVHPDDRERAQRETLRALESGQPLDIEARVVLPDGAVRHLAHRAQIERDAHGRRVRQLGVSWDVTERRTAEAALLAKETAERANQAKSEFLSRMSHELRTPLNAIIGFTQVLELDRTHPLGAAQRDRVDKIKQAGWHLLNLINEILDLSRIEAGAMKLTMAMVPLAEVVDECISLVAADAQRRMLAIGQTQTAQAPAQVWADRTRLKQVLLNLLSNAVKYNRERGRIDVDVDADAEGRALITVRDTGAGLTRAQIDKLFQPFNRLGMEAAPIEGTGIGLTIALRLVEQMGGTLTVTSEPGTGSAFRVALQAASNARDEAADVLQSIAPSAVEPRDEVRGTVLYVEDNPSNVAVVEQLLALRPNVKLFTATDGAGGRVMAAVCQPDLILLDMRLPDTDGLALLAELRARPETQAIPCIGLSANAMPADIAHARAAGFADYWTKPIEAGPFLRGIDAALARRS